MNLKGPIGVFDSGIGGLTVVKALSQIVPGESLVYLGDTAHVPYGNKSSAVVRELSLNNLQFLLRQKVKLVVVACNTSTAVSLPLLQRETAVPVVGVIEPGARAAVEVTRSRRIGVMGTLATVESGAYQQALRRLDPRVTVTARACPLLVPLAEEGWAQHPVAKAILREYLAPFQKARVDTLVLGCTHYPLFKPMIQSIMGASVRVIDSAVATAHVVREVLGIPAAGRRGRSKFFVTDVPRRFERLGQLFLGRPLKPVRVIKLKLS